MKLRPYEKRAVDGLMRRFTKHRRIVGVAPTGSGKTVIGAAFIRKTKATRVLWLAHRVELLEQARSQLRAAGIKTVVMLSGREKTLPGGPGKKSHQVRVLVASVSMFRARELPDDIDLVVIDECHHVAAKSYVNILEAVPQAKVLGLTATPWRLDGKPLGDAFDDLFVMADAVELIADGFIMGSVVYGMPKKKAADLVFGIKTSRGDYSARKLDAVMRKRPLIADIVQEWLRLANDQPTIVYACTIEHAKALVTRFRNAGITCERLDWKTPDTERAAILGDLDAPGRLATGETRVVVNVGILTEGIDCPPVKCIVLARPTKSLTLYRQMCGRGTRPSGAGRPVVLDHAGNTWRLGLPETEVEWSLTGRATLGGKAPVKRCDECGAMNLLSAKTCAECGATFPASEQELKERDAELERLGVTDAELKRKETILRKLARSKGLGPEWVERAMQDVV